MFDLLGKHQQFNKAQWSIFHEVLKDVTQQTDGSIRVKWWETLREFVARQKEFSDAGWAMKSEELDTLEKLSHDLQPVDPVDRYRWLFGQTPTLGIKHEAGQYKEQYEALVEAQEKAAREILDAEGITGIKRLIDNLELPGTAIWLGRALGTLSDTEFENLNTLQTFLQSGEQGQTLIAGIMQSWLSRKGRAAVQQLMISPEVASWKVQERAYLLRVLPADQHTWDLVQQLETDIQQVYWQGLQPYAIRGEAPEEVRAAFEHFRNHGRHLAAFTLAEQHHISLTGAEWISLLADLLNEGREAVQSQAYHLKKALNRLVDYPDVDLIKLAQLAWLYLPLYGYESPPKILTRTLLADGTLYADTVALAFPKPEKREVLNSEERSHRERALRLIQAIKGVPGTDKTGAVDDDALAQWVTAARARLQELDCSGIGDSQIGQLLASAPSTAEGQWPPPAVCDIVEAVASEAFDDGLRVGRYNLRGVTSRNLDSGGEMERDLASRYRQLAQSLELRWPRTASCLRILAQQYEAEARRRDDDAELIQDRWT